ncbi:cold shock domain-containing protein [Rossellomorea vietnamensis]|uniref:cold shock domain-containing protein n=1 Tax=Rossellomorea vietnamensis TaxID=218284 RepID=UPI00077C76B1|nr:cold shock domain-containing protein [Rossellomorea vietnamensis]
MDTHTLEVGLIKWYGGYNAQKEKENKFGFVERSRPNEDLFIHETNLLCSPDKLNERTVVVFEVRQNRKSGKNEAIKVRQPDFTQPEDLQVCAKSEHLQIWLPAITQLIEQLTTPDKETIEFIYKKFMAVHADGFDLDNLVEKIPDQIFFVYQNFIDFLPVERYLKISSVIYDRSDDDIAKKQISEKISSKLKNQYRHIHSFQNNWYELSSKEVGEIEWRSDDYKKDIWDSLPFSLVTDQEIWIYVPDHKKYSILLRRLNPSIDKEDYDSVFDRVVETAKNARSHETLPEGLKGYKRIFPFLNSIDQVETGWSSINDYWDLMNRDAKIRAVFRAAKEDRNLKIRDYLQTEKDLLVKAVLLLLGRKVGESAPLEQVHHWITEYITEAAWKSTEPLDLGPILPGCSVLSNVQYCEARRWPGGDGGWKTNDKGQEIAYCPRQHGPCVVNINQSLRGAHVNGLPDISWDKWTLTDFFESLGVNPTSNSLNRNDTYLLKIAGWVNRLNEIRERMKCEHCGKTLIPDKKYAFNPAGYNSTVARCPDGHGTGVYFNHCSNKDCSHIIDSRESSNKFDRYYICILCGDIPRYSRISFSEEDPFHHAPPFTPGDICPKCGKKKMLNLTENEDVRVCSDSTCNHHIYLKGRKTKKIPTNRLPVKTKNYVPSLNRDRHSVVNEIELDDLPWLPNTESEAVTFPGPTVSEIQLDNHPWLPAPERKSHSLKPQTVTEIELDDLPWQTITEDEFLDSVALSGAHFAAVPSFSQSYRCDICGGVVANDICTSCMFDWDS